MSFITIHFGDDQKLLFNLLCPTVVLYENIKSRCGCGKRVVVDIADENGSLKSLSERPQDIFASEYLQGRGIYVLLKVTKKIDSSSGKEFSAFEPLLNNVNEIYPDLMSKVRRNRVNPDVGLPSQIPVQATPKGSAPPKAKPIQRNKPRSPAQRTASLAGNTLGVSTTKIRSTSRTK
ncbi:uncharacterized protein C22orf15-like [Acropora muricata]|uniref:uncharacterized protein LOC114959690 n=1 Tax=Acropora millepora TaxID=45264 RepID=UPI001CF1834C|nr:uncharacterized protein LOC114959690 [Acropora millepora]